MMQANMLLHPLWTQFFGVVMKLTIWHVFKHLGITTVRFTIISTTQVTLINVRHNQTSGSEVIYMYLNYGNWSDKYVPGKKRVKPSLLATPDKYLAEEHVRWNPRALAAQTTPWFIITSYRPWLMHSRIKVHLVNYNTRGRKHTHTLKSLPMHEGLTSFHESRRPQTFPQGDRDGTMAQTAKGPLGPSFICSRCWRRNVRHHEEEAPNWCRPSGARIMQSARVTACCRLTRRVNPLLCDVTTQRDGLETF